MRFWKRAALDRTCGSCGKEIKAGAPCLAIELVAVRGERLRCVACAEEPCPPDLPALEASPTIESFGGFAHIRTAVGDLPFDFKAAAGGEREPGSDDE